MSNKKIEDSSKKFKEISLFRNPIETTFTLSGILKDQFFLLLKFLISHKFLIILGTLYCCLNLIEGYHKNYLEKINKIIYFCAYWVILGIASSIGLGTGLHTFVLYLGPHIAKVTLAANECSYFPEMNPSKWEFESFIPCTDPATADSVVSFWSILLNIQLEAFMWGLGTAIGELPPYFMAKAAAEAGKSNEEVEELEHLEETILEKKKIGFVDKIKTFIYHHLKDHGFITVLLCASIPNPLFDMAGILCGHFGISFVTFFGATMIGKAIIKVHIQAIFVILTFSQHHVEVVLNLLENNFPFLKHSLSESLEKQKKMLWYTKQSDMEPSKPLVAIVWEILITFMIVYFLISIINSVVNNKRRKNYNSENGNKTD